MSGQARHSTRLADAPAAILDAVEHGLGPLLDDRDVSEVMTLEGGMLQVMRRGRRQRLDVVLEGPLFALLRETLPLEASSVAARLRLRGGHALTCAALVDGRLALHITRAPALDVTLDDVVEEGLLPREVASELLAALAAGSGVLVLGPSRAGRQRLVVALARTAQGRLGLWGVSDELAGLLPVPLPRGADVVSRVRTAAALGSDGVCALELDAADVAALARACPQIALLASVAAATVDGLEAALDGVPRVAAASHVAVVGHAPDGQPRLMELHGPAPGDGSGALEAAGEQRASHAPSALDRTEADPDIAVPGLPTARGDRLRAATVIIDDPAATGLPVLDDLPAAWASDAPDDDPGWELGGNPAAPPAPGSFDAALAARKQQRPSMPPRPPREHPQAMALQGRGLGGDPFGGLTFEPPPGGAGGTGGTGGAGGAGGAGEDEP